MTAKRALAWGLFAWAFYIAIRSGLRAWLPANDWPSYVIQDLAVSVFRIACGMFCLRIARRRWHDSALGLGPSLGLPWLAWLAALVLLTAEVIGAMALRPDWRSPIWIRLIELAVALAVAFNEEAGFRALAYSGLRELWGRRAALLLSTLAFTLMHLGYQPAFHLPKVFFIGLVFAFLRDRGASLKFMVILHFAVDGIYALSLASSPPIWPLYLAAAALCALAAALAWKSPERFSWDAESLLFAYGTLKPDGTAARKLGVEKRCDLLGPAATQGKLGKRHGYPALLPSKKAKGRVEGWVWRLRDPKFLAELDRYEGDDYLRDKGLVQLKYGPRCEAWIYVAASGPGKRLRR